MAKNKKETEKTPSKIEEEPKSETPLWVTITLSIIVLAILSILVIMIWGNYSTLEQRVAGTYTFTPLPPTSTPTVTATPTITSTATPVPTPTNTPMPASSYFVTDNNLIDPPMPGLEGPAVVLDESSPSFITDPDFNSGTWVSSSDISAQLGVEFTDPYYATYAPAKVAWSMDVPLDLGLYEIYVMDTVYTSAGSLDFYVALGSDWINPVYGSNHVNYLSTIGNDAQQYDQWRSIGIYSIDKFDYLTIYTEWDARDEYTPVAVDRVMIVQLPASSKTILDQLPNNGLTLIEDDHKAVVKAQEVQFTETDELSWGDSYQIIVNPGEDLSVDWVLQEYVDPGSTYEVQVWIPKVEGSASANYQLLADGNGLTRDADNGVTTITHGNREQGQWVSLGSWEIPLYYESGVELTLHMSTSEQTTGEIAIDAVAFIKKE